MRRILGVLLGLICSVMVNAQEEVLTNQSILDMMELGFTNDVIVGKIETTKSSFNTTVDALKTLKSGECVGLFPEGTRNGLEKNDGKLKNGAAYLALKTGAKIVPIGIQGDTKPFTPARIVFGKPLDLSKYEGVKKVTEEMEDEVSEILKNEIVRLSTTEEI